MAWAYALDWWYGYYCSILSFLKNLGADAAHMFNAEASVPKPGVVMPVFNQWPVNFGVYMLLLPPFVSLCCGLVV